MHWNGADYQFVGKASRGDRLALLFAISSSRVHLVVGFATV